MAKEAIFAVKDAENQAQQLLSDAKEKSRKLKEESVIEGDAGFNRILEEGRVEAENIKEKALEEGQALANPILEEGQVKANNLSNLDSSKMDKAVNFIIERIVRTNGDS